MVGIHVQKSVFGSRWSDSLRGIAIALFLFTTVLLSSFVSYFVDPLVVDYYVGWACGVAGAAIAVVSAYRNSGIVLSWLLVAAPIVGKLVYTSWLVAQWESVPVPMIGSFYGAAGWQFWISVALILGTLCFGLGVAIRRVQRQRHTDP